MKEKKDLFEILGTHMPVDVPISQQRLKSLTCQWKRTQGVQDVQGGGSRGYDSKEREADAVGIVLCW